MIYAKIKNNSVETYPYYIHNLKADNPTVGFPKNALEVADIRTNYGIEEVTEVTPTITAGHKVAEGTPAKVSGVWTQTWVESLKDPSEVESSEVTDVAQPSVNDGEEAVLDAPEYVGGEWRQVWKVQAVDWKTSRVQAYGPMEEQMEYLMENGITAAQTRVADIKTRFPKS